MGGEIDGEGREGNKRDEGGRGDRKDMGHHGQGARPAFVIYAGYKLKWLEDGVRTGNYQEKNGNAILTKLIRRLKHISAPCGASVVND